MKISGIAISASSCERSRTISRRSLVAAVGRRGVGAGARRRLRPDRARLFPAAPCPARRAIATASQHRARRPRRPAPEHARLPAPADRAPAPPAARSRASPARTRSTDAIAGDLGRERGRARASPRCPASRLSQATAPPPAAGPSRPCAGAGRRARSGRPRAAPRTPASRSRSASAARSRSPPARPAGAQVPDERRRDQHRQQKQRRPPDRWRRRQGRAPRPARAAKPDARAGTRSRAIRRGPPRCWRRAPPGFRTRSCPSPAPAPRAVPRRSTVRAMIENACANRPTYANAVDDADDGREQRRAPAPRAPGRRCASSAAESG